MKAARVLRTVFLVIVLILAIAILGANFYLGPAVKAGVEKIGPQVAKVPITLEKANFKLLSGAVGLKNLVIGNPEGFNTPHLFKMGDLQVKLDVSSLTKDTLVIEKIYIGGPEINYEKSLKTSNIGQLLKNLEGEKPAEAKPEEKKEEPAAKEGGKKVVIKDFLLENAKLGMSVTVAGGHAIPIPLPPIHLTNIGEETGGASLTEVLSKVFGAVFGAITQAAGAIGDVAGEGAKMVGDAAQQSAQMATDAAKQAGEAAGQAAQAAGDAAKEAGGMAVDGAKAVGGAAAEGAKAVGGAVTEGAGKLFGGVKGLIPGQKKPETPADAPVIQPTAPEDTNQ